MSAWVEPTPDVEAIARVLASIESRNTAWGFSLDQAIEYQREKWRRHAYEAERLLDELQPWLAAHDAALRAEWEAEHAPEGFYVIPNRDAPDQDSLWDGTIHPTREAAQASIDGARPEWGQDAEHYHVVALMPVEQGDGS